MVESTGAHRVPTGPATTSCETWASYLTSLICSCPSIKRRSRASLVAQWLRICLQGTRVRALVWEVPTCHGATGPVSHNY